MDKCFTWGRKGGYEVSTKGDKRFSAFNARIKSLNNLSIETLYQCTNEYGKGHDPVGLDWRKGKGKPPINGKSKEQLYSDYKSLWSLWMSENTDLVFELKDLASEYNCVLSDCFASTPINQARALSELLNEFFGLP
jgi:hypothetical protein